METISEDDNAHGKRDYNFSEGRIRSYWSLYNGTWYTVSDLKYLWIEKRKKEQVRAREWNGIVQP